MVLLFLQKTRCVLLLLHELDGLARVRGIQIHQHDGTKFFEIDRLGHIAVESCVYALGVYISHDVGRQCNNRQVWLFVLLLPLTDFSTRLITVFVGHVEIALC